MTDQKKCCVVSLEVRAKKKSDWPVQGGRGQKEKNPTDQCKTSQSEIQLF